VERQTPMGLTVVLDGLARLRQSLEVERSLPEAAEILVTAAVDLVPGCDGGAVTEWADGQATIVFASSPALAALEEAQIELDSGPARLVITTDESRIRTEPGDPRWPEWGERAVRVGVATATAFRLDLPGPATTLTLYCSDAAAMQDAPPAAEGDSPETLGVLVATVGSIALSGVRRQDQLRQAIRTRDVIGQAKGILMHRWKLTADGAFDVLRRASSDTNIPLRLVAERVVAEGDVPKP
jgi:ANTAR domain-containing protein